MKQDIYTIESNRMVADQVWQMRLSGDSSAFTRGGQFVDIAVDGYFLRRPIAVRHWDRTGFDIMYKTVGKGTSALSHMEDGMTLDLLTGLGNGFDDGACSGKALVVCGGLGASPAFPLAEKLIRSGKEVTVILGFNKASDAILFEDYRFLGANPHIVTMDGSLGMKGLVTDAIDTLKPEYDYFYTCGPRVMMKAVCDKLDGPGEASLEERMGCGCGICYGCTCHTAKGPKRVCADGPVFKKEDIIW